MNSDQSHSPEEIGTDLPVKFKDGGTEAIRIRVIPPHEYLQFSEALALQSGEAAECAFYCGRAESWAADLDLESFNAVLEAGQQVNFPRYSAWFERQARKVKLLKNPIAEASGE